MKQRILKPVLAVLLVALAVQLVFPYVPQGTIGTVTSHEVDYQEGEVVTVDVLVDVDGETLRAYANPGSVPPVDAATMLTGQQGSWQVGRFGQVLAMLAAPYTHGKLLLLTLVGLAAGLGAVRHGRVLLSSAGRAVVDTKTPGT